jgi:hypothetical protein
VCRSAGSASDPSNTEEPIPAYLGMLRAAFVGGPSFG